MMRRGVVAIFVAFGVWGLLAQQTTSQPTRTAAPASQPASQSTTASAPATTRPAREMTRNYIVQAQVYWPDGRSIGAMVKLIRRTINPAPSRIVEERIVLHPFETKKTETVVYTIRGETMTFEAEDRSFTGEGLMQGPAGAWTGMTFRSTPASSESYTKGVERWHEGGMSAELEFFTTGDQLRSRIVESGMLLSDEAYNLLVRQMRE